MTLCRQDQVQASMYASPCLLHTGQRELPIQHRVRAAALQVYAAVQHGQGVHQQPVRRQQRKGTNAGILRQRQAKDAGSSSIAPPPDNAAQHAPQLVEERRLRDVEVPPQEQQLAYVPEPWDLSETWQQQEYADNSRQQQQQAYVREQWEDHGSQQRQQQPAEQSLPSSLSTGSVSVPAAQQLQARQQLIGGYDNAEESDAGDDEMLWLLEEEDIEDETQQQQDSHDGWLDSNSSSSSQALSSAIPAQQYARQQQQAQLIQQHKQINPHEGIRASSSSLGGADLQAAWNDALSLAVSYLTSYDVRFDVSRQPPFSRNSWRPGAGGVVHAEDVSLTAAAAAAAAKVQHARRRQTITQPNVPHLSDSKRETQLATAAAAAVPMQGQQHHQQDGDVSAASVAVLPDDPRWQAVQRSHAAYLGYMQQLSAMVVSRQQQSHQIVYQVAICEHWLQLCHILAVFGGAELTPSVTAAMWKRLTGIVTRKVFTRMSHAERCNYDMFIEQLIQQSITSIQQHHSISSTSTQDSMSTAADCGGASCAPSHLASTVYSMAVLGVSSVDLTATLVQTAAASLRQAAAEVQAAAVAADAAVTCDLGQQSDAPSKLSAGVQQQSSSSTAAAAAVDVCCWGPSEVASMMWGLGTIQSCRPDQTWLDNMVTVTGYLLSRCQSSQLWGVIWGFSRLGYSPPDPWLASWTAAAQQQLDAFNADALSHSIWALAELQYTPDRLWLRAFCGMLAHKIRSLMAGHLAMVLPALSSLGYRPRAELCRTTIAQARRHIHTFKPSQLCAVLLALASYPPDVGAPASTSGWHPGRLFLFDFISHSSPPSVMRAWTGDQASQVLWGLSRFRYVPDKSYLKALFTHIQAQLPTCSPDGLSMALWGLAALKQPLPSRVWGDAWCSAAEGVADQFGPQALAHGLAAMAALNIRPSHTLMQALTRTASGCLAGCSCMELGLLIAALADQHWRPSDAWMTAFVSQVSQQLPAFENEDWGLLLYGLASLAQPLSPTLLGRLCSEVKAKLSGISGEGLGLLVWGIAQYDFDMRKPDEWWSAVFKEFDAKWESTTLRGCALAVVGLSQLGPRHLPPGTWDAGFINRYKHLTPSKPKTWPELLMGLRAAAGLEAGEQLEITPWMNQLLLQLGRSWNLADPYAGGLADVNAQVAAITAGFIGAEGEADAASSAAVSLQLNGALVGRRTHVDDVDGFVEVPFANDGVEAASATVVLL